MAVCAIAKPSGRSAHLVLHNNKNNYYLPFTQRESAAIIIFFKKKKHAYPYGTWQAHQGTLRTIGTRENHTLLVIGLENIVVALQGTRLKCLFKHVGNDIHQHSRNSLPSTKNDTTTLWNAQQTSRSKHGRTIRLSSPPRHNNQNLLNNLHPKH